MIPTIFVNPPIFFSTATMFNGIFCFFKKKKFELQLICTIAWCYIAQTWASLGGVLGPVPKKKKKKKL